MPSVTPSRPRRARALTAVLAATFITLTSCGGGGGGTPDPAQPPTAAPSLAAAAPGDLAAYFRARLAQQAGQGATAALAAATATASVPRGASSQGWAGTWLQEPGVDEDDRIKTDGATVYALHAAFTVNGETTPARLTAQRRQPDGSLGSSTTAVLNAAFPPQGMYLAAGLGRLAVLGQKAGHDVVAAPSAPGASQPALSHVPPSQRKLSLDIFSTADTTRPASHVEIDGALVGSRMIGSVLYVVSAWSPDVSIHNPPAGSAAAQVTAALASLQASDLLPRIQVDGAAAQPLVTETDCYLQPANASPGLQLTTITAFDLATPGLAHSSRCFVGGLEAMYMSAQNVYFASSRGYWVGGDAWVAAFPRDARTDIHKFALQATQISYRGSGEVKGHLGWDAEKKPYRMSEYNGDLRVLAFTGETGWASLPGALALPRPLASPATLTVLRENAAQRSLAAVATLPNSRRPAALGHAGEQVHAVHFAGPQAYVVTFRRTDPLYVLDLSNPADPKTAGELTMPGYSDYLYPLPGAKLLGVGRDATADGRALGLKLALIDVADPAQPRLLASQVLGDVGTTSTLDFSRHGINLFTRGTQVQVALPVRVTQNTGGNVAPGWQGLARYVADTAAGTLTARPGVQATRFDGSAADGPRYARFDLAGERSVQMDTGAYYLSGGEVVYAP